MNPGGFHDIEEKVSSIANTGSLRMLMALTVLNTSF